MVVVLNAGATRVGLARLHQYPCCLASCFSLCREKRDTNLTREQLAVCSASTHPSTVSTAFCLPRTILTVHGQPTCCGPAV